MGRVHLHADGTEHRHEHGHEVGDHSGYTDTGSVRIDVLENLLAENDRVADANSLALANAGVRAVNLMSSPGAGKTTLLKRTLTELGSTMRIGVLEGDIATSLDADELEGAGARAMTVVNTSAGVGNLVCPAEFRVGEHAKAMVYAVTEGEEKPFKYPIMFRAAEVVVVNKIDLLPHLDFDLGSFLSNLKAVNPRARVIQASARTGEGVDEWCSWLTG